VTAPSDRVAKILALPDPHAWTGSVPAWLGDPSQRGIGQFIDHTLLKAEAMPSEIDHAAQVARELGTATVCINGRWVERVRKALEGSTVKTCAVVGFPLGAMASSVKADEARQAIADGAVELDMVMSLGEAQDLFGAVGDPTPATLYEVAGWLLAPAPDEIAAVAEEVEDDEQAEDQDAL